MKNLSQLICFYFIVIFSIACGGNSNESGIGQGSVSTPQSCDITSQKQFIVDVMNDTYFWYDEVPEIDIADYPTIEETLDALRAPLDRFSYITTVESNDNFFEEGTFEGFGFRAVINDARNAYLIGYIFDDSPSGAAGWKRTDSITAINGVPSSEIIAGEGLSSALSGLTVGDTATFSIAEIDNSPTDQVLTKALVTMNTVLVSEVVELENQNIGYIALSSFIENTTAEFTAAIDQMNTGNVSELVLDLRYNGGGRVSASKNVASSIGGTLTSGFDYSRTIHNDKYSASNSSIPFDNPANALSLSRVYILTTSSSCSASELVINSLSPFVEVIQIGGTTCGKPVGMYGKEFCDKLILPIEFQSTNHLDEGDYFDGLIADCIEADDLTHGFADPQEGMFASAIYHMTNGTCLAVDSINSVKTTSLKEVSQNWLPHAQVH